MKVLVTGGAGFIGSHTVDILVRKGIPVVVVDNLSQGKEENLNQQAAFYPMDIRSEQTKKMIADEKIDYVIHLAAQTNVQVSMVNPAFDASVNVGGTLNLLEACLEAGVKKIVFSSSAACYGEPLYLPVDEKHPLNARSGYGLSKQTAEKYLLLFREAHGLEHTILRYANVYGPRQVGIGEGGVVAVFTDKLLNVQRPSIFGDGEQTRDFIFVEDVARANLMALFNGSGSILNVSTGKATSVNLLFNTMAAFLNKNTQPIYAENRKGDIKDSVLSNELTRSVLNWAPQVPLKAGLELTCKFYQAAQVHPGKPAKA